jgi:hypothetical protein
VDPEVFKIINGKLYLSWSKKDAEQFANKGEKAIKLADENWEKVNKKK